MVYVDTSVWIQDAPEERENKPKTLEDAERQVETAKQRVEGAEDFLGSLPEANGKINPGWPVPVVHAVWTTGFHIASAAVVTARDDLAKAEAARDELAKALI